MRGAGAAGSRPVLVARPAGRGGTLARRLEAEGLRVEHRPFLELALAAPEALRKDLADLAAGVFSHLVVTSRTAAEALAAAGAVAPADSATCVVAVGEGTASALAEAGLPADLVAGGSGAALVAQMPLSAGEQLVWFPASAAASPTVPEGLEAKGYRVRRTVAYRPHPLEQPPVVTEGLAAGRYAALVLTSPMIARLAAGIGVHPDTAVVSIGDPTSAQARAAGLTVTLQAASPDDPALARAVHRALTAAPPSDPDG